MDEKIILALVAATSAAFGTVIGGIFNYAVARRTMSKSAARLRADLELLERAQNMNLDQTLVAAIEDRVRYGVYRHTESSRQWVAAVGDQGNR